jgi:predicted Zn-dependent protease
LGSSGRRSSNGRPGAPIPGYVWAAGGFAAVGAAAGYYSGLETVPLTGRRRWIATSPEFERRLGDEEYAKLLASFRRQGAVLPPTHRASQTVQRVGKRIAAASQAFHEQHGGGRSASGSTADKQPPSYTYTVVRSEQANAFVLPGNHVFVLTGLFRYVGSEDELAAVLGHEMAHVVARHAGEKVSRGVVLDALARLSLLADPSGLLATVMLPTATLFRELPHSRTQEMEADRIGVVLSATACYDPRAAETVFARMAASPGGAKGGAPKEPPEFLSTHPSHESRIGAFASYMPDAMKIYRGPDGSGDRCRSVRRDMERARLLAAGPAAPAAGSSSSRDW